LLTSKTISGVGILNTFCSSRPSALTDLLDFQLTISMASELHASMASAVGTVYEQTVRSKLGGVHGKRRVRCHPPDVG